MENQENEVQAEVKHVLPAKPTSIKDLLPRKARMVPTHEESGEPLPTWIDLTGQETKEFQRAYYDFLTKSQEYHAAKEAGKKATRPSPEEYYKTIASCVIGWDEDFFGKFSKDAVLDLLAEPAMEFLRNQIQAYTSDRANFFGK